MAESGKVLLVELDVVKRQAEGSSILDNAYRVIRGESLQENKGKHDFLIVYEEEKERVADKILLSIKRLLDKSRYNYTIDDIQVICPQRTSEIGTDELNRRIQELVNPPKQSLKEVKKNDNCTFRVGDKVMHMANDYEKVHYKIGNNNLIPLGEDHVGIFNGDMGRVIDVIELPVKETEDMEENLVVKYDNFVVIYNREELQDIELSYAMSIHKSQGAQFKVCLIPFHFRNYKMLNRNLGYTALTRAEEIACVFGQKRAMDRMCKNIEVTQRNTRLKYLI
jgi:exodeoxyribonuclease V alpha subunit